MATLKDLSRHLGLSVTQVSRALNGHSDVNEQTRARVQEAAKLLKYQPNISARRLVTGRSGTVGLVVPPPVSTDGHAVFVEMISGLSASFAQQQVHFLLHVINPQEDPVAVHRRLIDSAALDGFVITDPVVNDPRIAFLRKRDVPFVVHGRLGDKNDFAYFDIDNYAVAHRLTTHLTGLGHQRIAFLNGVPGRTYVESRLRGHVAALAAAGIAHDPDLHRNGMMNRNFGLTETIRLMLPGSCRPTAIIAGNMLIALGVYDALQALGLRISADVSVVAHDDHLPGATAESLFPALTTTSAPLKESWGPMASLLVQALDGQPIETLQKMGGITFFDRASCGGL